MTAWMIYLLLLSGLMGMAGAGLESALRAWRLPGRWAVASGLLASTLLPLLLLALPAASVPGGSSSIRRTLGDAGQALGRVAPPGLRETVDGALGTFWILSSLGALLLILGIQLRLSWMVRRAEPETFDGIHYRRTRAFGPAVVGCLRSVILLPSWAVALEPERLRLILIHETEHLRARDQALLFGGVLVLGLQPWNLFLWGQFSRLRKAIELDCDQRVLGRGTDIREYAELLLAAASRRTPGPLMVLPLGMARSSLARRVEGLADFRSRIQTGRGGLGTAVAAALLTLALLLPVPALTLSASPTPGTPQALLVFSLPGDSVGGNETRALRFEGEEAARVMGALSGAPAPGPDGRVIRRIIRPGPEAGGASPPSGPTSSGG